VLRIEENRMVRDIGGGEVMETRWRPATKAEVREIVRRYNETLAKKPQFRAIDFERPLLTGVNKGSDRDAAVTETTGAEDTVHASVDTCRSVESLIGTR
jgi:hypothetical protein